MIKQMAETIEKIYVSSDNLGHYDEKSLERQTNAIAVALQSAKDFATGLGDQYDKAGTAATKVKELADGAVKTNTDAIATLNGADTVDGSVAKAVKDAKTELEGKITASKYDDTKIKADIAANTASIETLNGTGDGSVDKKVADAVAAIVNNAPESYDTLKEISDWISGHENDASAMNSAIQTNKTDIANLAKLVGALPEGDASKTIVEYIDSKVGAVDFSSAIATAKQEAIDASKTYSDGLATNYATADQGAKADTALQEADVATLRTDVADVKASIGEDGATTKAIADAKKSGTDASAAVTALANGQVATNTAAISVLSGKVETLEGVSYKPMTNEEIDALFVTATE